MLKEKWILFILSLILSYTSLHAERIKLTYSNPLEEKMFNSIIFDHQFIFDTLTTWLIAQGYHDMAEIDSTKKIYQSLLSEIRNNLNPDKDNLTIAKEIFSWMRKKLFTDFVKNATIKDLLASGSYNLINSNAIYYLICTAFDIPIHLIRNPYYVKTSIKLNDQIITIDIFDQQKNFGDKKDKKEFVDYLIHNEVIDVAELKKNTINEIYDSYFSEYKIMHPFDLAGYIYYKKGYNYANLPDKKLVVENYEKAIIISPNVEYLITGYGLYLGILYRELSKNDFLPYFRNSLFLFSSEPSYSSFAIPAAREIILEIAEDHRDYSRAMDLLLDFKTTYVYDNFVKAMNETENDVLILWTMNLVLNGDLETAYAKALKLFNANKSSKKHKDIFIHVSTEYSKTLVFRNKNYNKASRIMDSLLVYKDEYPVVEDIYMYITLAPFQFEYRFAENNHSEAIRLAHKVYKIAPDNPVAQHAISQAYHHKAMALIRRNDLENAHRVLVKGLRFIPNDKLLNEDLDQLEEAY